MMKKRLASVVLILLFIVILTMGFFACSGITLSSKHTIIFNVKANGEWHPYTSIRTFGNEIVQFPTDPTQSDGVFAGWYKTMVGLANEEVHEYSFKDVTLTEDVNLYAKFVNPPAAPYSISFETNGGSAVATQEVAHGEKVKKTLIETTKKGCTFAGWFKDEELTKAWNVDYDRVWSSLTLYAKWDVTGYKITYELGGGTNNKDNPAVYNFSDGLTLKDPTKLGYEFLGWYLDDEFLTAFNFETLYEDDITVYAKWQIITYNITYELESGESLDGEMPTTYTVEDDLSLLPKATKLGYDFNGWYIDEAHGIMLDTSIKNTGDLHLTPVFSETKYMITYELNGGTNAPGNPTYATYFHKTVDLTNPTRNGYDFDKWYTNPDNIAGSTFTSGTEISEDVKLYAKWNIKHYLITYHLSTGESCSETPNNYTIEDNPLNLPEASKDGYYFSAWYLDSGLTEIFNKDTIYYQNLDLYPAFVTSELVTKSVLVSSAKAISIADADLTGKNLNIPIANEKNVISVEYEGSALLASQFYYAKSTHNLYIANAVVNSMSEGYRYSIKVNYDDSTTDKYSIGLASSSKYKITAVTPYSKGSSTNLSVYFGTANPITNSAIERIEIDGVNIKSYAVSGNVLTINDNLDGFNIGTHLLEVMTDKGILSKDFIIANNSEFKPYNVKADIEQYPYTYIKWDCDLDGATFAVKIDTTTYSELDYPAKFNGNCFDASGLLKVQNQTFSVIAIKGDDSYESELCTFKYNLYASLSAETMKELVPTYLENSYTVYGVSANTFITSFEELYDLMFYSALYYDSITTTFDTSTYADYKALYVCFDFDIEDAWQLNLSGKYYYHKDSADNNTTHLSSDEYRLDNSTFILCMIQDTLSMLSESTSYSLVLSQMSSTGIIPGQTYKIGIKFESVMAPNVNRTRENTDNNYVKQDYYVLFYHESNGITRADYKFPIELQNKGNADVYTSRELYLALEHGYNPIPHGTNLTNLYNKIKNLLKGILDEDMSDYEIALALYQWLGINVYYDHDAATEAESRQGTDAYDEVYGWSSYYMEGVFNNKLAVCNGIAAAYSTMLNMMGIPCHKVNGTGNGGAHTWNELEIGGYWYISDPTWASVTVGNEEVLSFENFLTTYKVARYTNNHIDKNSVYGVNYADDVDLVPSYLMKFVYNDATYCLNNPNSATISKAIDYIISKYGTPQSGEVIAIPVYTTTTTPPSMTLYGYKEPSIVNSDSEYQTWLYEKK
ncbi:MAG: hypothetical protein E7338_03410 [Clostridiales bacterium]|nr:hypothetical protein [Clostridiales bacterium]